MFYLLPLAIHFCMLVNFESWYFLHFKWVILKDGFCLKNCAKKKVCAWRTINCPTIINLIPFSFLLPTEVINIIINGCFITRTLEEVYWIDSISLIIWKWKQTPFYSFNYLVAIGYMDSLIGGRCMGTTNTWRKMLNQFL